MADTKHPTPESATRLLEAQALEVFKAQQRTLILAELVFSIGLKVFGPDGRVHLANLIRDSASRQAVAAFEMATPPDFAAMYSDEARDAGRQLVALLQAIS